MVVTLSVEALSFAYGRATVLDDVGFRLSGGRIACLVGPNGAGKSTLIKCICRVLSPDNGRVLVDDREIGTMKSTDLARIAGYVPQSVGGGFPHTVFDEVLMGRRPYIGWRVSDHDVELVSRTLVFLGLEHLSGRYFDELSGGERQKVTIARALAQEPQMLLLDEPTSNLDVRHQLEVMDILRRLADERGILVLMAMHDLNLAARYSDTILLMRDHAVCATGSPAEVLTSDLIEATYGVRAAIIEGPHDRPHIVPLEPSVSKKVSPEDTSHA